MDIKYDFQVDLERENSHSLQLRAVAPGSRVLEFGCATGYLSRYMQEQLRCRVTGVELVPEYAERARPYCERVVVGDLDQLDLAAIFGEGRFDVALFGDVLEHLKDPRQVLTSLHGLLEPQGLVVATIPNVAHGDVRLALLAGNFEYRRLGLLDETHLRFFTLASARQLFEEAGFVILSIDRIKQPLFQTELGVDRSQYPAEVLQMVLSDPEATTYQYVIKARPANDLSQLEALRTKVQQLQTENETLRAEAAGSKAWADRVQTEYSQAYDGARGEIAELVAEIDSLRKSLREVRDREQVWIGRYRDLDARTALIRPMVRAVKAVYHRHRKGVLPNEGGPHEG